MTKLNLSVKPAVVAQSPIVVTPIMVVNATKGPAVSIDIDGAAKAYKGLVLSLIHISEPTRPY